MKRLLLLLIFAFGIAFADGRESEPIRVMTFNIRLNTPADSTNAWPNRKDLAARLIQFHDADLVGMQEALPDQVTDLADRLPDFGWIGVGRDDGKSGGEYCPIFYRKNRFRILENGTFWLSETPDSVSRGWDAACNRIVTWAKFKDRNSNQTFYLFNTHLDHLGQIARRESALLIKRRIRSVAKKFPVVLIGDFNATPDSEPIRILLTPEPAWHLIDSKWISKLPHYGPSYTFTGFDPTPKPSWDPIDYIFVTPDVNVVKHATLSDIQDGHLPSDHYPVFAEIELE